MEGFLVLVALQISVQVVVKAGGGQVANSTAFVAGGRFIVLVKLVRKSNIAAREATGSIAVNGYSPSGSGFIVPSGPFFWRTNELSGPPP